MSLFSRKKAPEPTVIDLREPEPAPAPAKAVWGSPVPCPTCSGRGYLDHIDPFREIMYIHCTECGQRYEVARAELEASDASGASTR